MKQSKAKLQALFVEPDVVPVGPSDVLAVPNSSAVIRLLIAATLALTTAHITPSPRVSTLQVMMQATLAILIEVLHPGSHQRQALALYRYASTGHCCRQGVTALLILTELPQNPVAFATGLAMGRQAE